MQGGAERAQAAKSRVDMHVFTVRNGAKQETYEPKIAKTERVARQGQAGNEL